MANSHPGSYCGQDAYSDMLVTENDIFISGHRPIQRIGPGIKPQAEGLQGCYGPYFEGGGNLNTAVRRLTPLECERLQGYPDGWTAIGEWDENTLERYYIDSSGKRKKVTDSARYKALGNSIALPFWRYLARRIMAQYEHEVTMGSLFDGIGGFPLVFSQCGCKPVWASEIEEFPIAVTKEHFPESEAV
jgi:DNA (cytosine-5)-methyltransferase 1